MIIVGLLEFLYQEAPDAMRSVESAYAAVAGGLGCFFATMLNNVINGLTGNEEEEKPSWLSQNINSGSLTSLANLSQEIEKVKKALRLNRATLKKVLYKVDLLCEAWKVNKLGPLPPKMGIESESEYSDNGTDMDDADTVPDPEDQGTGFEGVSYHNGSAN
ncbi:Protein NRT1/ PTR FAMILY 6.1 [Carex littledalei]|uniref:Protein NRT1/ PTR FAMILY 6.1 n=1 Tax=Carex littledalei TaxID=544730 RepID=A0A833QZY1_9POAL|nr:Protein NRT1/ PTR FAMILY 6.1 [Carex littledalei]